MTNLRLPDLVGKSIILLYFDCKFTVFRSNFQIKLKKNGPRASFSTFLSLRKAAASCVPNVTGRDT